MKIWLSVINGITIFVVSIITNCNNLTSWKFWTIALILAVVFTINKESKGGK